MVGFLLFLTLPFLRTSPCAVFAGQLVRIRSHPRRSNSSQIRQKSQIAVAARNCDRPKVLPARAAGSRRACKRAVLAYRLQATTGLIGIGLKDPLDLR